MTQALNLALFANKLNTSGQTDNTGLQNSSVTVTAGTGMSGGGAVALGSSVTLTNAGVTSIVAGTGISVSGATGDVTVTSTVTGGVTSLNGQTGAITNTTNGVIGSYVPSPNAVNIPPTNTTQTYNAGDTTAGTNLRVNFSSSGFNGGSRNNAPNTGNQTAVWNSGGTSLTGTWRAMQRCQNTNFYDSCSDNINASWGSTLWVRVS